MNQSFLNVRTSRAGFSVSPNALRSLSLAGVVALGLSSTAVAQAGSIYRCTSNTGVVEYSNSGPGNSDGKKCEALNLPVITTIPAPKSPAPGRDAGKASADGKSFPRVSTDRQQKRDDARKKILRDEMRREREKLKALRDEYQGGEPERLGNERNYQKYLDRVEDLRTDITRGENNISALQQELEDLN